MNENDRNDETPGEKLDDAYASGRRAVHSSSAYVWWKSLDSVWRIVIVGVAGFALLCVIAAILS